MQIDPSILSVLPGQRGEGGGYGERERRVNTKSLSVDSEIAYAECVIAKLKVI